MGTVRRRVLQQRHVDVPTNLETYCIEFWEHPMNHTDQAALTLALASLKATDRNIEAMALEAIADDPTTTDLDAAIADATRSDVKAGAFGMELTAAVLVPVLVEAAKQFWSAYSRKLAEKSGEELAEWTITKFKAWILRAEAAEKSDVREKLVDRIRSVGTERAMSVEDIDAIVTAMTTEKLSKALGATR